MNALRNRSLERRLRKLVRLEVKRSPELKKHAPEWEDVKILGVGPSFFVSLLFAFALLYPSDLAGARTLLILMLTLPAYGSTDLLNG